MRSSSFILSLFLVIIVTVLSTVSYCREQKLRDLRNGELTDLQVNVDAVNAQFADIEKRLDNILLILQDAGIREP